MNPRNIIFGVVTVVCLMIDQLTKWWIMANVDQAGGEITVIPGLFSIVHRQNPGAAFGLFRNLGDDYRHWVFIGFAIIATVFIGNMLRRASPTDTVLGGLLGLILSGAFGNAADRLLNPDHTVTDFLKVYIDADPVKSWLISSFGTNEWPSFNVADAALVVGVIAYVIYETWFMKKEAAPAQPNTEQSAT